MLFRSALPAPTGTTLWRDDSQTFEVRVFQPVNHERERHSRVAVEWFLDGQRIDTHKQSPGSIFSVQLRGDKLAVGTHELIARTRLISPYLRRDMGRSTDCVAWTLNVTGLRRPELRAPHKINANEREFIRFKVETAHLPEAFDLVGEGMPEGASFDPETRIFSWRPSPSQTGIYPIGFSATNGQYTVRKHVELTVRGRSENYGPVCDHVPSVQTQAGTLVRIQLKATDLNGDQLRYRFLKAPNQKLGLRLDQTTGEISWLVPHHLEGAVELAWEASDGRKSSRGKVLIIIDQGHLTPASEFPGHEIGLGLWSNSSEIRSAVLSHLDNQPLSLQVLALTRLLRDVNGQIRTQAADQLQRLLASTKQKEAVLAAGLFLGAERENLHQHCVTPGAWSRVSSLLTLLSEKQDLSSGLRKQATQMKAQLEQIRDEHAGF